MEPWLLRLVAFVGIGVPSSVSWNTFDSRGKSIIIYSEG